MIKHPTVAIYTGVTKSTTFIERLISGLRAKGTFVYVFGAYTGEQSSHENIRYVYHNEKWHKLFVLIKYIVLLILFKPKEKKILDAIIAGKKKSKRLLKLKFYPVLYHKPDVFHVQWAKSIEDWIWVEDFGMRLVLSLRGAHINYSPVVDRQLATTYKKLFPEVSAFHAVSKAIAQEALKYNANSDDIQVVKSGLKLVEFPFTPKAFDPNSQLNMISVGRNHWIKNYRMALDAIYRLKQQGIEVHYKIIGVANSEALVFQRDQFGLNANVSFLDTMPFADVQSAIKEAHVMLLTSIKEGIANVVLEAMALGTLVVSTDCGGMSEVITSNQTGFLTSNNDVQAMFDTLLHVSQLDLNEYLKITKQARAFIEAYHDEDKMVAEMQALYASLIPQNI